MARARLCSRGRAQGTEPGTTRQDGRGGETRRRAAGPGGRMARGVWRGEEGSQSPPAGLAVNTWTRALGTPAIGQGEGGTGRGSVGNLAESRGAGDCRDFGDCGAAGADTPPHQLRPRWEARGAAAWGSGDAEGCLGLWAPGHRGRFSEPLLASEEELAPCRQGRGGRDWVWLAHSSWAGAGRPGLQSWLHPHLPKDPGHVTSRP